jgi:enoyl-CoA hydratase/carnithine racemase
VGPSRALELIWSARMVPAAEALALGLFDGVVPADRLMLEARALAEQWAAFPPGAVRRAKSAVYGSDGLTLAGALEIEIVHQNELFATPEARDRIEGANPMKRGSR